ncbi:PH domain-containing protein [Nocardioides pelophilus]|uniref:PH domain-containing protein n=1 Tax=Nocardioides pelophilus TaxID=2172019 RepID=UPI0028B0CB74|nr:PH domain-containing protein [Nocardioides pelophilus]
MSDFRDPSRRVSARARALWRVECAMSAGTTLVALLVAAWLWDTYAVRWWVVGAAIAVATAYVVVVPEWRYLVHRWEVTETAVYTQRGWWARERRIAPMSRVQTVDLAQGALARAFRLATVTVTTASAAGPLRIDGLDRDVALGLVAELTAKADLVEGDAT